MTNAGSAPLSAGELDRMRALINRQDILDCLSRIARGSDRFDRELFVSGFHPDAVVSTGNSMDSPDESFESGVAMHDAGTFATLHCLANFTCEIDGDTAHVETYYIYAAHDRDESNWAAAGRYVDQFERREGVWGIVFRHLLMEWTGRMQPNAIAMFEGVDSKKSRLSPARSRDDVSYLRPLKLS
jgi:hypothetical protein